MGKENGKNVGFPEDFVWGAATSHIFPCRRMTVTGHGMCPGGQILFCLDIIRKRDWNVMKNIFRKSQRKICA